MPIDTLLECAIALSFFAYIVYKDKRLHKNDKVKPYHKPLFRKKKPYDGKFILSCRDLSRLENDHTDEYINECWEEIRNDKY